MHTPDSADALLLLEDARTCARRDQNDIHVALVSLLRILRLPPGLDRQAECERFLAIETEGDDQLSFLVGGWQRLLQADRSRVLPASGGSRAFQFLEGIFLLFAKQEEREPEENLADLRRLVDRSIGSIASSLKGEHAG